MDNQNQDVVLLSGEVNAELAKLIRQVLESRHPRLSLIFSSRIEDAHAVVLAEVLAAAAAIAAVLDFLLNLTKRLSERRKRADMIAHAKAQVKERLEEYKAYGYEFYSIDIVEAEEVEHKVERVVIKDVPNQSLIEVKMESKRSFLISRRTSRQNTNKDR